MFRALILTLLLFPFAARAQETLPTLVIAADSNLGLPLSRIVREYARERRVAVALALTESDNISSQIVEGSSADVLITARTNWLTELKQQGLVDIYSESSITADRLALVGAEDFNVEVDFLHGFPTGKLLLTLGPDAVVALGHPQTLPEARQVREALKKLQADADLEPYILYLKQRQQMYDMVRNQNAISILPATDARNHGLKTLALLPETAYSPIVYKAVVLAGENMDEARRFVEFLKSESAIRAYAAFGFITAW